MAEFQEVMKQRERMCDSYKGKCTSCIFWKKAERTCVGFVKHHPQEAEEIIMKWASEHPIKSNADKFEEVFGLKVNENGCPFNSMNVCRDRRCCDCELDGFWKKEHKEQKGD